MTRYLAVALVLLGAIGLTEATSLGSCHYPCYCGDVCPRVAHLRLRVPQVPAVPRVEHHGGRAGDGGSSAGDRRTRRAGAAGAQGELLRGVQGALWPVRDPGWLHRCAVRSARLRQCVLGC